MTASTVKRYLEALVDRGLITAERSLALDVQCITSEKFFTLPNEVFLLQLPPSAFMVYAYLLLIEDRQLHIRLLHHMGHIFQDQMPSPTIPGGIQIDRKRLAQLREKKVAMGHKPDDYEEPAQNWTMTMG